MIVGTIREIWRYPVKSMFGERVEQADIEMAGFAEDRCWAVRDDTTGEIVGGRKFPRLMLLKARYVQEPAGGFGPEAHSTVAIEFPDGRVVHSDQPDASAILSMFLGQRVSLLPRPAARDKQAHRLARPMSAREIRYALGMKPDDPDPDFSSFSIRLLATLSRYTTPPGALYDVYPLHFLTTAALETMREHYPEGDFRVERYRPSFVIETSQGLGGIIENDWRGRDLQIGAARIRCNHPTIRCSMPGAAQPGIEKDPNIPLALMRHANQHLGAYATPRHPSVIRVGDSVELLPRSSGRLTVSLDRLGRRIKSRAIGVSNRLTEWQDRRVQRLSEARKSIQPHGFRPFELVQRREEAVDIVSFVLADPGRAVLPRFIPGQHVVLAIPLPDGRSIYRPYSLSAAVGDGRSYRITVKRETQEEAGESHIGAGSNWLHQHLAVGDSIALKGPAGQFADVPGDSSPLVLISAGIGITPFMAMLEAIATENPERHVTLLHAVRRPQDFAFSSDLRRLQARLTNGRIRVFVSQPGDEVLPEPARAGRLDIREQHAQMPADGDAVYFLCGRPAFTAAARSALLSEGVVAGNIRIESFGSSQVVDRSDTTRYQISCTRSQRSLSWDPRHDNLLSFVEEQGVQVESGCRYGACQACEVTLLAGDVRYPPEIQPPAGKNKILLCSARPKTHLELDL